MELNKVPVKMKNINRVNKVCSIFTEKIVPKSKFVVALLFTIGIGVNLTYTRRFISFTLMNLMKKDSFQPHPLTNHWKEKEMRKAKKVYDITWYNPPYFFHFNPNALYGDFNTCMYDNCIMKFDKKKAIKSDAVIFDGFYLQPKDYFEKKPGQVWIYSTIEAPTHLHVGGHHWMRGKWASSFNWTMSYDKSNNDIYLPFGEITQIAEPPKEVNYSEIFHMKNKTALIVHSHCRPPSKRDQFLKLLGKFIEIDSFGDCGKRWNCGQKYKHDDCFKMINEYKFYLAFENSFCNQYFTEKVFRNFNYDSLIVVRGGRDNERRSIFPEGTYISTDDFPSVKDLADYLIKVASSEELYVNLLKQKKMYYSIPYEIVYKRAMCQLCEKLNKQNESRKGTQNITEWAYGRNACKQAQDLNET